MSPISLRKHSRGVVAVLTALLLPVLIGFAGLAVDAGYLYAQKRKFQTAADGLALACANQMQRNALCSTTAERALALDLPNLYGIPWTSVATSTPAAYQIRVVVSESVPTFFMKALGISSVTVSASATAEMKPTCLYTLNSSDVNSFTTQTGSKNEMPGCGVYVNSSHATSALNVGTGSYLSALPSDSVWVVGGVSGTGTVIPTPRVGVAPVVDPLAALPAPAVTAGCTYTNLIVATSQTLSPGNYCNGIRIMAPVTVNFSPGLYVLKGGGLKSFAGSKLFGTGVTFYNTASNGYAYDGIDLTAAGIPVLSKAEIDLAAPSSGSLKGVLFFQDRAISVGSTASIIGSGVGEYDLKLSGVLYFPTTALSIQSGTIKPNGVGSYTHIVAYNISLFGENYFNYLPGMSWATVSGPVRLVE